MAYMILFSYIGMPCIYYGSEIGITGNGDPDCRRTFDWNEENWNQGLLQFCKELISLRRTRKSLAYGSININEEGELLYLIRHYEDEKTITIINNTSDKKEVSLLSRTKILISTSEGNVEHLPAYSGVMIIG